MKEMDMMSDYEKLCVLIAFESQLLELQAELRWETQSDCDALMIAFELGWLQQETSPDLSDSCADVLSSIHTLGEELIPRLWSEVVATGKDECCKYEDALRYTREKDKARDNKIKLNNIIFRKLCGSENDTAGDVYIQDLLPRDANYCVQQRGNARKIIAVLSSLNDATAAARYSASHDGGYGDVCIATTSLPTTHTNFEEWFMD